MKNKMEVFNELLETIEKRAVNNQITITNVELFVQSWKREAEMAQSRIDAIAFAEWVAWNEYERFEGGRGLWLDKKSSYSNPLPIKTTRDLWNEFVWQGEQPVCECMPDPTCRIKNGKVICNGCNKERK